MQDLFSTKLIISFLDERDRKQVEPFNDLIEDYQRILKSNEEAQQAKNTLEKEN